MRIRNGSLEQVENDEIVNGTIEIPEGVTYICKSAFEGCTNLTEITIPEGVTHIWYRAFKGCTGLTEITIPEGVTEIEEGAFSGCTGLTKITIPNSIERIGEKAFEGCTSLTNITIPEGVTEIGQGAFERCTGLTEITIPKHIIEKGGRIFSGCTELKNIKIPDDVTRIGKGMFAGCTGLKEITIPEGVTSIGWEAFKGCTNLAKITIPEGVTEIGQWAFRGCTGLKEITITEGDIEIGRGAFEGCDNLKIIFKEGIDEIGSMLKGNKGISEIIIPRSVKNIKAEAFSGCTGLTEITIPEGVTTIGRRVFEGCIGLTEITIPEGVTYIWDGAFEGCTSLTEITIPEGVTEIGEEAFLGCKNLVSLIKIPSGVKEIGYRAFLGCEKITEVRIAKNVITIGAEAFSGCKNLEKINIPESIEIIGDQAFYNCINIAEVKIPEKVTEIGEDVFAGCSNLEKVEMREGLQRIGRGAFSWCESIDVIRIPESIEIIGDQAFYNCINIAEVKIPEKVTEIGKEVFAGCSNLEKVEMREGLQRIGRGAFSWCESIDVIRIPDSVTEIGEEAFSNCIRLTEITVPEGVFEIGEGAFARCSNLEKVEMREGLQRIGRGAFSECESIKNIRIPESVTSIESGAFRGCSGLTEITVPEGVFEIGEEAFSNCIRLTEITVPESVTSIESGAFWGCSGLIEITIPEGVFEIGEGAFARCSNLEKVEMREGLQRIGEGAFNWCESIDVIRIPDSVTEIGEEAFSNCIRLTEITIPEGVFEIGEEAFARCSNLEKVEMREGLQRIRGEAFKGCIGLTKITIPDSVTEIGEKAFEGCAGLTEITIPDSVTKIGEKAFEGCTGLKNLTWYRLGKPVQIENAGNIKKLDRIQLGLGETIAIERSETTEDGKAARKYEIALSLSQDELIRAEYIKEDWSQEEKDKKEEDIREKVESLYNNNCFSQSRNYNHRYGIEFVSKMIAVLGIENTEEMLRVPESVEQSDIERYGEAILEVYEPRYKLQGDIAYGVAIIGKLDKIINNNSNINALEFYKKLNGKIESGEDKTLSLAIKSICEEMGVKISQEVMEKVREEIQNGQVEDRKEEIVGKIRAKIQNQQSGIDQQGRVSGLIYKVIKSNILQEETKENIEKTLLEELARKNIQGEDIYGESIKNQKDKILEKLQELYDENPELLNAGMLDVLKRSKKELGDRWIMKIKNIAKYNLNLKSLTEEGKKELERIYKEELKITNPEFEKSYQVKEGITDKQVYSKLDEIGMPDVLTYEKSELMFSSMQEPYSERFRKWFMKNKDEIMQNGEYYSNIATIHNRFEGLMEDFHIRAAFTNGSLTVKTVVDILNKEERYVKPGNEELGRLATIYGASQEEVEKMEEIFETTKQREKSYVPQVNSEAKKYRGRILRADDPLNILAGNATNCCQRVGDVGEGSMWHGSTENRGRIFVVFEIDEKGNEIKPVAQSWVWRNKDTICFDNIEVPTREQADLTYATGDIAAQEEILDIYKECAKKLIETDEKMFERLLKKGKITQEQYDALVLKDVRVGTGYNDLGILEKRDLERAKSEIMPKEIGKTYNGAKMWVDSGGNDGYQLILAKGKNERQEQISYIDLEDVGLLYKNKREVRKLRGSEIDEEVIRQIERIEKASFRGKQQLLQGCTTYEDVGRCLGLGNEDNYDDIRVRISREKDWYMIYEEREEDIYIADIASINGVNSQKTGEKIGDIRSTTFEMAENLYEVMLQAAEGGKKITLNATEDTSYINLKKMAERGIITIEKDKQREWSENRSNYENHEDYDDYDYEDYDDYDDYEEERAENGTKLLIENNQEQEKTSSPITMHDMVITVNKEKIKEELERVRKSREKAEKLAEERE